MTSTKYLNISNTTLASVSRCCIISLLCTFSSCNDFVEVDLPSSQLSAQSVFQDKATASSALLNIYADIRDSGLLFGGTTGSAVQLGCYTDEFTFYGLPSEFGYPFYNNNLLPSNNTTTDWWTVSYRQIYAANAVIEGLAASQTITQQDKDTLTGEALFLRTLVHFYLLNLYGDIPYAVTTDYRVNSTIARTPISELYPLMIGDLQHAVTLLPEHYITGDRTRANKAVAMALLSRIFLYNENFDLAETTATSLINDQGTYSWVTDLDAIFLKESATTIWQLLPRNQGFNTNEGSALILTAGPPSTVALTQQLLQVFEPGDQRVTHWVGTVSDGVNYWSYPNKYKEKTTTSSSLEYSIIFRLAEQYLIRAEARTFQGNLTGAKEDLNLIRNTAGLTNTPAQGQQELFQAIIRERRVELFSEMGHRFFDLKRTQNLDAVLGTIKPGWDGTDKLMPIPENELLLNPVLTQNPGY